MKRTPKGRLELTWMGKDSALIPAENGKYDYAWVDPNDPRALEVKSIDTGDTVGTLEGPDGADENLLIVGDSGDALRSLGTIPEYAEKYLGQVKLVYIDPPFNTEQTFEHYADQLEHSVWLTMMRDRIRDIKPLLAPDASVWVHLDDAENHRMRVLLDEEFGAENFVAEIVWQKAYSPRNDATGFSTDQDYILVYSAQPGWVSNRLPRLASRDALYKSTDGDERPWISGDPAAPARGKTQHASVFGIQNPITGEMIYPARRRTWALAQSKVLEIMREWGRYELGEFTEEERANRERVCGEGVRIREDIKPLVIPDWGEADIRFAQERHDRGVWPDWYFTKGGRGGIKAKRFLDAVSSSRAPQTLWLNDEVGHNREGKHEINLLFPHRNAFATPKPERLLERVIYIGSKPGDLVLDCFAGSGTSAAVAHKMGRRWVTVELQEPTVETFIVPRLTKVVNGEDPGGVSTKTERVPAEGVELPEGMTPEEAQKFTTLLGKVTKNLEGLDPSTIKTLRTATMTRDEKTVQWCGGGGFTVARMGPSMYEVDDTDGEVYLSAAATNGAWSKAVAGQLKFTLTPKDPVFCGAKNRQRLAVIDGVADETVVRTVVDHLGDKEKAVIVAKGILPEAEALLASLSPGSRIKKAPTDMFPKGTVK